MPGVLFDPIATREHMEGGGGGSHFTYLFKEVPDCEAKQIPWCLSKGKFSFQVIIERNKLTGSNHRIPNVQFRQKF